MGLNARQRFKALKRRNEGQKQSTDPFKAAMTSASGVGHARWFLTPSAPGSCSFEFVRTVSVPLHHICQSTKQLTKQMQGLPKPCFWLVPCNSLSAVSPPPHLHLFNITHTCSGYVSFLVFTLIAVLASPSQHQLVPNSASMKLLRPAELDSRSTDPDPTSTEQPR